MSRLQFERLEERALAAVFQPTGTEQLFLELLNAARANPAAYGESIGLDLSGVAASQPLAFNLDLIESARLHSQDMHDRGYFDHCTPIDPTRSPEHLCDPDNVRQEPGDRIDAAGYPWTAWAESLAAGEAYRDPAAALEALIIDAGIPDLGHRRHLLAMDELSASLPEVGIGNFNGSLNYEVYYTIDGARDFDPDLPHDPFLTGVVYDDIDEDRFYSVNEGYGGVTIHAVGPVDATTTTFASGGYSLQLPPGTYSVTVSGAGFPGGQTVSVTLGSQNVKQDFRPVAATAPVVQLGVWSADWKLDADANSTWDDAAGGDRYVPKFGNVNRDVPAAIDWDGDGRDELAYFRFGSKLFIDLNHNGVWDGRPTDLRIGLSQRCEVLGNSCDQLVVGDWNGDGRDDFGVLHVATGMFQLDSNGNRAWDAGDAQFRFVSVAAGDVAVAGDWDGDGVSEVGIFRSSRSGRVSFLLDLNGNGQWDTAQTDRKIVLGPLDPGARPAPANYDSDPRTELAVFSTDTFYVADANYGSVLTSFVFTDGLRPVPGHWM